MSVGCSDADGTGSGANGVGSTGDASECVAYEELIDGRCVDPIGVHEPRERVDFDNVVDFGGTLTELELPDPPKSGFRLVVPPRTLEPGEETTDCVAWAYPELTHANIYAARLITTGALHHSNMYGIPFADTGPSAYPECAPGQSDIFSQVPKWMEGDITDVLFANSTQIEGGETIAFPPGMAFPITTEGREIATSIHWLNAASESMRSEIVYDFFTMPSDQMTETLVPFVFENQAFTVPPQTTTDITTTCDISAPGHIVSLMPHNHERTTRFTVDLLDASGASERIMDNQGFTPESDIKVFADPVAMETFTQIRHSCTVENELAQELVYGTGVNEMCTLFGYLYPPEAQQLGIILKGSTDCVSLDVGSFR